MGIAIGIFATGAMTIALGATILTNIKLWGLVRESRRSFRQLPAEKRRSILLRLAGIYALVLAEFAIVLAAPFGVRRTLTYFVILPFVVLTPIVIVAVGIHGFRGQRQRRPPNTSRSE